MQTSTRHKLARYTTHARFGRPSPPVAPGSAPSTFEHSEAPWSEEAILRTDRHAQLAGALHTFCDLRLDVDLADQRVPGWHIHGELPNDPADLVATRHFIRWALLARPEPTVFLDTIRSALDRPDLPGRWKRLADRALVQRMAPPALRFGGLIAALAPLVVLGLPGSSSYKLCALLQPVLVLMVVLLSVLLDPGVRDALAKLVRAIRRVHVDRHVIDFLRPLQRQREVVDMPREDDKEDVPTTQESDRPVEDAQHQDEKVRRRRDAEMRKQDLDLDADYEKNKIRHEAERERLRHKEKVKTLDEEMKVLDKQEHVVAEWTRVEKGLKRFDAVQQDRAQQQLDSEVEVSRKRHEIARNRARASMLNLESEE